MGWEFKSDPTRLSVVRARTAGMEEHLAGGLVVKTACLASCYRGGPAFGVLWSVWERTSERDGQLCGRTDRWINCDLLKVSRGCGWGSRTFAEVTSPPYYSCPLAYLEMVPLAQFGGNAHWRSQVSTGHARQAAARNSLRVARRPDSAASGPGSREFVRQLQPG